MHDTYLRFGRRPGHLGRHSYLPSHLGSRSQRIILKLHIGPITKLSYKPAWLLDLASPRVVSARPGMLKRFTRMLTELSHSAVPGRTQHSRGLSHNCLPGQGLCFRRGRRPRGAKRSWHVGRLPTRRSAVVIAHGGASHLCIIDTAVGLFLDSDIYALSFFRLQVKHIRLRRC